MEALGAAEVIEGAAAVDAVVGHSTPAKGCDWVGIVHCKNQIILRQTLRRLGLISL